MAKSKLIGPSLSSKTTRDFVEAAQSESTRRSYAQGVRHFIAWGGTFPAKPEAVAAYLAEYSGLLKVATLEHRLIAIHQAHLDRDLESAVKSKLVRQTMEGIRRTFPAAPRRVTALCKDDLVEILVGVAKQKPLKAARDKALLLLGWAGALRRSELVALTVEDVTKHERGIEVLIRRSKTDQHGQGQSIFVPMAKNRDRCPVSALEVWLDLANIESGPLFRPLSRHDKLVGSKSLTPQSVALVVQASVRASRGHESSSEFAGHSLRAGYATTAVEMGVQPTEIMRVTRHKSVALLLNVYVRPAEKRNTRSLL